MSVIEVLFLSKLCFKSHKQTCSSKPTGVSCSWFTLIRITHLNVLVLAGARTGQREHKRRNVAEKAITKPKRGENRRWNRTLSLFKPTSEPSHSLLENKINVGMFLPFPKEHVRGGSKTKNSTAQRSWKGWALVLVCGAPVTPLPSPILLHLHSNSMTICCFCCRMIQVYNLG